MSAWSYSSLTAFETCSRRFAVIKIHKLVPDEKGFQAKHGDEVHQAIDRYGRGVADLPATHEQYRPLIDAVLAAPGEKKFETKFALTEDLQPTEFFGRDVWCRGILDLRITHEATAVVLDWKTGKPKQDGDQLRLFAAATFALEPSINTAKVGYVWLAYNLLDRDRYVRDQAPAIWDGFRARVDRMERAIQFEEFPPKPSGLCRAHCPVPRKICEFSGRS